jgi:hypothetical protein
MNKVGIGLIIGILAGFTIGLITSPQIEKLLLPGPMRVEGKVEYSGKGDPSASGTDPEGYYISNRTRFYLTPISSNLVGKIVNIKGNLKLICGQDLFPCYPLIKVDGIEGIRDR